MSQTLAPLESNPYLRWVCDGEAPPLRASLGKAEEAAQGLARHWVRAKRRLANTASPSWEHLDAVEEAGQNLAAVVSLFELQAEVSRRVRMDDARAWTHKWTGWMEQMNASLVRGRVAEAVRQLQGQATTPHRRRQTQIFFDQCELPAALTRSLRIQETQQTLRDEAYVEERRRVGGVWARGKVEGVHRSYLTNARKAAKERGLEGYLFKPWTEEAVAAMGSESSELRRLAWHEDSYAPVPMRAIEKMRKTRHGQARACGRTSYAELRFSDHMVYPRPDRLIRDIQRAREQLLSPNRAFNLAAQHYAQALGHDIPEDTQASWNTQFFQEQAGFNAHMELTGVFPWRETCLKAMGELIAQCGWRLVRPAKFSGKEEWSIVYFHIEHALTGKRTHLLYAPFRPRHKGHSYFAGVAVDIINRWSSQGVNTRDNTVWVTQALDLDSKEFTLEDLRVLCHEMGHALHFSAMPGRNAIEIAHLPEDTTEIPSYLLEMYYRDPSVLARWASKKGPAAARRARFWKRKLAWGAEVTQEHLQFLRFAQLDLMTHLEVDQPFRSLAEQLWAQEGQPLQPEDDSWKRAFIWDSNLACVEFTQSLPQSLVRRMITVPDHGAVDARVVANTFQSLLNEVLVDGDTPSKAAKQWRQWAGESFATSLRLALVNHARQSARITRKGTTALKKKLAREKARRRG